MFWVCLYAKWLSQRLSCHRQDASVISLLLWLVVTLTRVFNDIVNCHNQACLNFDSYLIAVTTTATIAQFIFEPKFWPQNLVFWVGRNCVQQTAHKKNDSPRFICLAKHVVHTNTRKWGRKTNDCKKCIFRCTHKQTHKYSHHKMHSSAWSPFCVCECAFVCASLCEICGFPRELFFFAVVCLFVCIRQKSIKWTPPRKTHLSVAIARYLFVIFNFFFYCWSVCFWLRFRVRITVDFNLCGFWTGVGRATLWKRWKLHQIIIEQLFVAIVYRLVQIGNFIIILAIDRLGGLCILR